MISSEKATQFLKSVRIKNLTKKRVEALSQLPENQKRLGLLLINEVSEYKSKNGTYNNELEQKRRKEMQPYFSGEEQGECIWETKYPKVLPALLSGFAPFVIDAWKNRSKLMYQVGHYRRSFRAPESPRFFTSQKVNWLERILEEAKYDLSLADYARYDGYLHTYYMSPFSYVFAAAIESETEVGQSVEKVIIDTIHGKDQIGKISRSLIKSLLLTEQKEHHVTIEKLLLAAQRQEGLRQSILECLDETSLSAQKHLMKVVLDHNLLRFSSVVRALDVWCGMQWESAKVATLKRCMQLGYDYLTNPSSIDDALLSKDNLEIYMALWASGCIGIEQTIPKIKTVAARPEIEKQATALFFTTQIGIPSTQTEIALPFLKSGNLLLKSFASRNVYLSKENKSEVFPITLNLWNEIGGKKYEVKGKVFSWTHFDLTRESIMHGLIEHSESEDFPTLVELFNQMEVYNRKRFAERFLQSKRKKDVNSRPLLFQVLADRSEWVREVAFQTLKEVKIEAEEAIVVEDLLKRKSADLRKGVLQILFQQEESDIIKSTERLLNTKNIQQRLGGLDLLNQLHQNKIQLDKVQQLAATYKERKKLSDKELIILSNINANEQEYNLQNGFGLYDPNKLTTSPTPIDQLNCGDIFNLKEGDRQHPYDVDLEKLFKALDNLLQLIETNKNYEYETEYWDNTKEKVLLGNRTISSKNYYPYDTTEQLTPRKILENYPLAELWEKWYQESNLDTRELWFLSLLDDPRYSSYHGSPPDFVKKINNYFKPDTLYKKVHYKYKGFLRTADLIIDALSAVYPYEKQTDFALKVAESILSFIPQNQLVEDKNVYYYNSWRNLDVVTYWLKGVYGALDEMSDDQLAKLWHLQNWIFRSSKKKDSNWRPHLLFNIEAFQRGILSEDDLTEAILFSGDALRFLTVRKKNQYAELLKNPVLKRILDACVNRILDIELKRGDTETELSSQAIKLQSIYGIDRLISILSALKKENLHKGYIYAWGNNVNKKESLSHLLRVCYPSENESFIDFSKAVKTAKISEQRLLEVAMYAPQWIPFVQEFLGWKKLTEAVWWFHAHTKESGYAADDRWTADVNIHTKLTPTELSDGAVDVQWFKEVYTTLKKARWEKLYQAAKYISTGPGYRRAQIFADAMSGKSKQKEVTTKITEKRNQEYIRALGLLPLSRRNPQGDILKRYRLLQRFLKESKQFGAQRQASEKIAVKIALDNLARTANYPDPIRLSWAMEALEAQEILEKSKPFVEKEVTISLQIDELGKAQLIVRKANKPLKAIPAKLRKNKAILQLKENQKILKEQHSRTRKALEEAMCRGDEFQVEEIEKLFQHPVVAPQLKNLVFTHKDENKTSVGYYKSEHLCIPEQKAFKLPKDAILRIAHCTDLHTSGNWSALQKECFQSKRVQPFKQIFRELYLPTADELTEVTTSRRYAGHQVQPKKTIALLKNQGWIVDPEEGLRKVYHKENLIVNLFAIADWFTPSEIEAPTLETVSFSNRSNYKLVPFQDISPLIFSEVMRDIDLVVSVAYAGGVDPEASHSTIEMRTVMAVETALLLSLNNVAIKGSHLLINGTLGDYSLHLGSGVIHKMPGGYLSILPVHSSHRGRIFLPFADDDPKTSEILSKMLLLVEDDKIQDPTILRQL